MPIKQSVWKGISNPIAAVTSKTMISCGIGFAVGDAVVDSKKSLLFWVVYLLQLPQLPESVGLVGLDQLRLLGSGSSENGTEVSPLDQIGGILKFVATAL